MDEPTQHLKESFRRQIVRPLERLGSSIRRQVLLEGLAWCACALIALSTGQYLLDRLLVLGIGPRLALAALVVGLTGYQLFRRVLTMLSLRAAAIDVASVLERRHPEFSDRLVTAVSFAGSGASNPLRDSPALVRALMEDALRRFDKLPIQDVIRRDRFRRCMGLCAAACIVVGTAFATMPEVMSIYVQRNWLMRDAPWPVSVRIEAEGFTDRSLRWPIGDELVLTARAVEGEAVGLRAEFEYASGDTFERTMDRLGENRFILEFGPLAQAMRLRFVIARFGVDDRTQWYTIDAVERPSVRAARIEITPPDYARQDRYTLAQGQATADIIRGSRVRIEAEMNKPIGRAVLKTRADERFAMAADITNGVQVSADFEPQRRGTYFLDVVDLDGLDDRTPVTYTFNLMTDPPPKVRMTMPGVGEMVVPGAQLRLHVEGEDNLGMSTIDLRLKVNRGETESAANAEIVPLPGFVPGQQKYTTTHALPLMPMTLNPGDRLTLHIEATDEQPVESNEPVDEPAAAVATDRDSTTGLPQLPANVGRSIAYTLRIVTPEELQAELARRENEWRREFEQIIKSQEQINFRVLDLRGGPALEAMSTDRAVRYAQEARTQRQQINRVRTVLRQFEQILDEMEVNVLATPQVRRRLQNGVIVPMRSLVGAEIAAVADALERLRDQFSDTAADEVEEAQKRLVRTMQAILADMLKWEGYNEAVALVREIVRLQQEVTDDTQAALDREIDRLFGGNDKPTTRPAREDQP